MTPRIDIARLQAEIEALAEISEAPAPAVTRVLFSAQDLEARGFVKSRCGEAGLELREDAVGNLFARLPGRDPSLAAVATGSHIDAIPNAGKFDGVVGVLGGLEALRAIRAAGFQPRRSIELIAFTAEEPTRFGIGCLGSRLLGGALAEEQALALKDADGRTLAAWLEEMDFPKQRLAEVKLPPDAYHAFVELHIEQGPLLERDGLDIGAVTAIAGPSAYRVRITGEGGHAGAVVMPDRHDAYAGAAEFSVAFERAVRGSDSPDTVGTIGALKIFPGAINSIPAEVLLEIDLRDTDAAARGKAWKEALAALEKICGERGLGHAIETINADPPAAAAEEIVQAIEAAAAACGCAQRRMVSRAYHDTLFMALAAPVSMIFIPCRNGWSHRPEEFSSPEHIEKGATVLAQTLLQLADK